jgi:mono/diheme cytochrome c family protein
MRFAGLLCLGLVVGLSWFVPHLNAAPTPEQTAKVASAEEALKQAGKLIIAKKFEEAVPLVQQAQNIVAELQSGNADGKRLASGLEARFGFYKRALDNAGIKLPEPPKPGTPGAMGVSFTKEIVPIFTARCAGCHINRASGNFSLANFNALMKGSDTGRVIFPGKSDGSRLVDMLAQGDMPRTGGPLPDTQIALIAKWIDQGAKFDGTDPNAPIAAGAPAAAATPQLQVAKATGKESVLFARDIAPVLAENCTGCHGDNQPRARLGLDTFRRLLAGSENGPILTPGKGSESLIVRKLKGQAGERMPLNRPALPDETIAKFEKWVNEGAKFDGSDPNMNVGVVARTYRATVMTHEELAAERAEIADKNWQLANPDDRPEKVESDQYIVLGNVSEDELAEVLRLAEQQQSKVGRLLKHSGSGPLVKGRMTFFVFRKHYDYAELGRMVEKRELPKSWQGHFRYNIIDAYAGLVMPQGGEASLTGLVTEQLAGVYLESLSSNGNLPTWFSQGSAWAVAAALDAKDPRVKQWEEGVGSALRESSKPEDFLTNGLPPTENAAASYSFCKFLMGNSRNFAVLLTGLKEKKEFNEAFIKAYGAEPKALTASWAASAARKR